MMNNTCSLTLNRTKMLGTALAIFIGLLYMKVAVLHLTFQRSLSTAQKYARNHKEASEGATYGSATGIAVHLELQDVREQSMNYDVQAEDQGYMTQQLEELIGRYRARWSNLTALELKLFLEEAIHIIAPRLLPFVTYAYKGYQFLHNDDIVGNSFYPVQEEDDWRSSITPEIADDGTELYFCTIGYSKNCHCVSSPEEIVVILVHEMVHRARMHHIRRYWHELDGHKDLVEVQAPDFLRDELHVPFPRVCENLSQHQESEADYCAMIALRSEVFIKAQIVLATGGIVQTIERSTNTHPSSLYRMRMSIEYWIRFLMSRDHIDYNNACAKVGAEYRALLARYDMSPEARRLALQISPDNTDFSQSL